MEKKKIPQIRFRGFEGEWEEGVLNNIATVKDGTHDSPKYYSQGYPLVTSKNLEDGKINLKNVSYISDKDFNEINKRSKVDEGDILLALIGTIGNPVLVEKSNFAIKNVGLIKKSEKINNLFLLNHMRSFSFEKYINLEITGNTQKFLSLGKLRNYSLNLPKIEEQEKIGELFEKIDKLIESQSKLIEENKKLKKSLLQKMFPQKNEKIPQIRLKGFSGDWEEKTLNDLIRSEYKGKAKFAELDLGEIEYLDAERLNGGQIFLVNSAKDVNKDDILILWDGSNAGKVYYGFEGVLGSTLKKYIINKKYSSIYVYFYLLKEQEKIYCSYRTPNIPHVTKDFTETFKIKIPSLEEQKAIGNLFKSLDDKIYALEDRLNSYKAMKKSLLQKMFV